MGKGLWDKVLRVIGFETEEVEEPEERPPEAKAEVVEEWSEDLPYGGKRRGTLVSLPGQKQVKVVVVEPKSFEEVQSIADHLKSRRSIILNLEGTDKEQAQRILNFLSGTIYALGGEMQRISNGIFFFAPSNVDVTLLRKQTRPVEPAAPASDPGPRAKPGPGFIAGQAKDLAERRGLNIPGGIGRDSAEDKDERGVNFWNK